MDFYFTTNKTWVFPNGDIWKPEALLKVPAPSRTMAIDLANQIGDWEYVYDEDAVQSLTEDDLLAMFPAGIINYNDIIIWKIL